MEKEPMFTWSNCFAEVRLFGQDLVEALFELPLILRRARNDFWYAIEHPRPKAF